MGFLDVGPGWVALMCALYYVDPLGCFWPFCAAMLCHELGHAAALWASGVPIRRLRFNLGGAVLETGEMDYRRELLCALAGPAANVLMLPLGRWFPTFAVLNLCLGVFNLLPAPPLDGGRALRAGLLTVLDVDAVTRITLAVSALFGLALAGVALALCRNGGIWPVLVAGLAVLRIGLSVAAEAKNPL